MSPSVTVSRKRKRPLCWQSLSDHSTVSLGLGDVPGAERGEGPFKGGEALALLVGFTITSQLGAYE